MAEVIKLHVVNSLTILSRIIEIIKRRRINIKKLNAIEHEHNAEDGNIEIIVDTDAEQVRLLKKQFTKQIDVIQVL